MLQDEKITQSVHGNATSKKNYYYDQLPKLVIALAALLTIFIGSVVSISPSLGVSLVSKFNLIETDL